MKKFFGLCALAVALADVPTQEASAWVNFRFGAGVDFSFDRSGRGGRGHGGQGGHQQQYMYILPEPYQLYGSPQPHYQPVPQAPQQPFPPPPARERSKSDETIYQNYNYPYLGYSIYQPTSGYGYAPYYTPALRFDQ